MWLCWACVTEMWNISSKASVISSAFSSLSIKCPLLHFCDHVSSIAEQIVGSLQWLGWFLGVTIQLRNTWKGLFSCSTVPLLSTQTRVTVMACVHTWKFSSFIFYYQSQSKGTIVPLPGWALGEPNPSKRQSHLHVHVHVQCWCLVLRTRNGKYLYMCMFMFVSVS